MFDLRKIIEEDNRFLRLLEISLSPGYDGTGPSKGKAKPPWGHPPELDPGYKGEVEFLGHEIPPETTHLAIGGPDVSPHPSGYPPLEAHEWNALGSGDVIFAWIGGEEKSYDVIRNDAGNILALDRSASQIGKKTIRVPLHFKPNYWHKLEREKAV